MANTPKETTGAALEAGPAAEAAAPPVVHDRDLQRRYDEAALELGLIDEALTKAGFALSTEVLDGTAHILQPSARVDLALELLGSSREASEAMAMIADNLAAQGMQVEGEAPFETVIKLIAEHKSLTHDLAQAQQSAEEAEAARQKAADDLAKKPRAVKGAPVKRLRACGPVAVIEGEEAPGFDVAGLLAHIGDAETVELAFSDGTHELADAAPLVISGAAWSVSGNRLFLSGVDVPLYGASREGSPFTLAGYGLFVDGRLAAYAPRVNGPLQVSPGTQHSLNDDVVFG
jgi:hypothetical protein